MIDIKIVGTKIALLRKSFGYSQEKLAEILCVSPQAVSKWENGHSLPNTSLLPVLSQLFRCSIDEIIMPAFEAGQETTKQKSVLEQQAEHIADYIVHKTEKKLKEKEIVAFDDDTVIDAVAEKYDLSGGITVVRKKTSRADGKISTGINIITLREEIKLTELIYHKRSDEFHGYCLLNDYIPELPNIYCMNHEKKAVLLESFADGYIRGNHFRDENSEGKLVRNNYGNILSATAGLHKAFWENGGAFRRMGLMCHFETEQNMLAWIDGAMERPFKKYKKAQLAGKIPEDGGVCGKNNISEKELGYYDDALRYLKTEYPKLITSRFLTGKNITVVHGDLHPGAIFIPANGGGQIKFTNLYNFRMGLCTEDLAMLVLLHIAPDNKKDVVAMLDGYYNALNVKDYSYDEFMSDLKISIAENMFFPIRLINRGIFDFRMRDKAIQAFKIFVV